MAIWNGFVQLLETILLTFYTWTGSSGLAIILFTIVARVVILPLTLKSLQSTRRMQELQPQMKELQRKYGKDQQKLSQETMKLYREYKINPAGGCLPIFLQLPIFLGVYQAVIHLTHIAVPAEAARQMINILAESSITVAPVMQTKLEGGFLWLPNLGERDPLFILPVLSIIFQLIVQLMATPRIQDPQQKAMMQSMLILPIVFGYIGFTFPSGAVLYWVMGSILSMIQQYVISGWGSLANYLKFLPPDAGFFPPPAPATALAGTSNVGSVSDTDPEETSKVTFWDILRPLTEPNAPRDAADDGDNNGGSLETTAKEAPRSAQQPNPRRRKARR
jgi:YidC/Oxa1 family membrane protein insertase